MQIAWTNKGCYFDEYQHDYPIDFYDKPGYCETHTVIADDVSQGGLSEICFQGVRIHYGQFQTVQSDTIRTTEDFASVELLFQLQGRTWQQSSVTKGFDNRQHNLIYRPYSASQSQYEVGLHQYVGIQLTESFFNRFADDDSPAMGHLLTGMAKREATLLSRRNLPISPALHTQLTSLTQSSRSQPLKRLYLEGQVLDLLRQQIEQAEPGYASAQTTLKSADIDKIWAVKDQLERNPLATYSLLQLAHWAGLNDYKLKKGFRELFGTTVFGYLTTLRMQYAYRLLLDTNQSVGDVASLLGYSEPHHFSAAFKRHYGYLPSLLTHRSWPTKGIKRI